MAAAARRSGTRSPLESTLKRGSAVSATSRAMAAARARASVCFRDADRSAEYAVDRDGRRAAVAGLAAGFAAVLELELRAGVFARALVAAAAASIGRAARTTKLSRAMEA